MKKLGMFALLGSVFAAAGSLVLMSCASQDSMRTASRPPAGLNPPPPPPPPAVDGIGSYTGGIAVQGNELTRQRDVQEALRASQQGGGGDGRLGFYGDIPCTGPIFGVPGSPAPVPPGPIIAASDELWIIAKPSTPAQPQPAPRNDDYPGCGSLMTQYCTDPAQPQVLTPVPVPLKHTEVWASVLGYIASVHVQQQFVNPYATKIEALYVFPLPENAGVNEFVMTIGERHIRGIIRPREEARQIYDAAKAQGYTASLLEQDRPNIFSQAVANIEPGKAIDIDITYFHTLAYQDGAFEFVFPMVVGPRYNPAYSTGGVGAASRGIPGKSGQATEVQYLRPNERSGSDIAVTVDLDAGVPIEAITCRSHAVDTRRDSMDPGKARITLSASDRIPNTDFVLRYAVAGDKLKSTLITQADDRGGGYFSLLLVPPRELASAPRVPMEMVFVIDRSGSMQGVPINLARQAAERGLRLLQPQDSFQIIDFAESASQFGPRPLEATPENVSRGLAYLSTLDASGGTEMLNGIKAALDFPHDPRRLRFVCFLTDGFIGNESDILSTMAQHLGDSRVFGIGIGSAPNRYLISEMSKMGRGAVAYIGLNDPAAEVMEAFFERASRPALANVSIDWGGAPVSDVTPGRIPDLFIGRPVILTGRYRGGFESTIRIRGTCGNAEQEILVSAEPKAFRGFESGGASAGGGFAPAALSTVWARSRINELAATGISQPALASECLGQVRMLALSYGLMSPYTSFVAVDSLEKTEGSYGTTVANPVPVPEGVRYETTVNR